MRPITLLAVLALTLGGCGGRSSNNNSDGGTAQDAADDTAQQQQHDAAVQDDASSPTGWPSPGRITCGNTTCDAATQLCCALRGDGGIQDVTYSCIGASDTCGGTSSACDEPGDCQSGNVCCRPTGGGGGNVTCTPAASCTGRELCHVDADCPTDAPACCPSTNGSYASCRTSCGGADGGTPDGGRPDGGRPDGGGGGTIGTPSPGSIECGTSSCTASTQYCCALRGDGGPQDVTYSCIATNDTCAGTSLKCDEPGDCATAGQVCCRQGQNGNSCMDAASCTGATARQLCHADGDCTTTGLTQCCPPTYGNDGRCSAPGSC